MAHNQGIGYEKACRLSNTCHSEIAPSLSLPSLPVCFGDSDRRLGLYDEPSAGVGGDRPEILDHASVIAGLLQDCDIGYLNLKEDSGNAATSSGERSRLYDEVLKYNPEAFECSLPGPLQGLRLRKVSEKKPFEQNILNIGQAQRDNMCMINDHSDKDAFHETTASAGVRKPKTRRKEIESVALSAEPGHSDQQDAVGSFCEMIEDFCGRLENHDELDEVDDSFIPMADIKMLVNEIMSVRTKKILQLVPIDSLVRLITVLDRQVQRGQILAVAGNGDPDADAAATVLCALESTYAVLAIMTHQDMPKQLYKEEIIERILDFSKEKIMDIMAACNPISCTPSKSSENGTFDGDEEDEDDIDDGSAVKRRRNIRSVNAKKSSGNKVSGAVHSVVQKLCSIQGFLKDLISVVRLSDSCIIQLVKTSFSTFLVDNIQLLQLKSINLICGIFASYTQHRSFVIDETLQLLLKLQPSKRSLRSYHLPDEEQKQIQMVSALLIQLVQFSANLPEILKTPLSSDTILDVSIDSNYPIKCHEGATEACCLFWTSVLQRISSPKSHDVSECKVILENLVMDLLTTLNLPEYPASASILEVLCVLLLQNAGLKSKDIPARGMAIEVLGTIAARLKHDAVICSRDKFWILQVLVDDKIDVPNRAKDVCSVCLSGKGVNIVCNVCPRTFHADCIGVSGQEISFRDWSCRICLCKKQLTVLQSYCKMQNKDEGKGTKGTGNTSVASDSTGTMEVVQQVLLNYLQETGSQDDSDLFTRWFYLCLWFKDDPSSQDKIIYYLARLKSKSILRDSGRELSLSRNWAKKICLALGQNNSFIRGFDKILSLLLATLRENSPVLRAKALRAVSSIVEADPEVLCDSRVQPAVEGRFCDSAISVREAALELVGRHIASHPDVGLKYFAKVAERMKDTGVSVRKRSIKIIRDLCSSISSFSDTTSAFIEILSRVTDEESSVQDLVCKTFYEFWFEEPSGSQTQFVGDGSSVPMEIATKTEQIVDVLRRMSNHHLLVTVIKRNLALDFLPQSAKATGINAVSLASVRKRCELICKRLLERILQVEERNSDEEEVRALPYVLALHAFCLVDPMLCTPATDPSQFVVTLQPYLKNKVNHKTVAQLLESIVFVIDAVLPLLRKPQQSVIVELEQDLKNMIVRHSFMTVVHACVRCLCSLSKIAGKGASLIEYLIMLFLRHLQGPSNDNRHLLGRSLFCLGLLLRYGSKLIKTCNDQHLHFVESLLLLKDYLRMEDFNLKVRALQALGYLLIAKPDYMLEKDIGKILEASLYSGADSRLKMQVLQNMYEYLLDAEIQLVADNISQTEAKYPENAGTVPVAAGAGDTNICGGIVQLYWNSILERCLDVSDHVRQSALKIVEIVLRQGLVHPITCVPCLVALETDPLEANAKLAHHLLMNMNEKYPAFFENRLGDGLQLSFIFINSVVSNKISGNARGKPDGNVIGYVRTGISRIYRLIRGNRVSRNKFIHSIVRKFESGTWNFASVPFLVYCTEILASLPFTCPDEPLYLIYDINRVLQLRAGGLEANMKAWSSLSRPQNLGEMPNETIKDDSAMQPMSEINMTKQGLSENTCSISREDMQKFEADCHDAIALQLLLKLKRHLKIVYGLNDARCQAFSLKEHPKPGETISRQNVAFNISDNTTYLPSSFQEMVQKYQEFKAMLKDDTMDYATYTATIKRKRPPAPRSSTKGGKAAVARGGGGGGGKEDDDDSDDDDWTGGPKKLDFSASNGARLTRQRLRA